MKTILERVGYNFNKEEIVNLESTRIQKELDEVEQKIKDLELMADYTFDCAKHSEICIEMKRRSDWRNTLIRWQKEAGEKTNIQVDVKEYK